MYMSYGHFGGWGQTIIVTLLSVRLQERIICVISEIFSPHKKKMIKLENFGFSKISQLQQISAKSVQKDLWHFF